MAQKLNPQTFIQFTHIYDEEVPVAADPNAPTLEERVAALEQAVDGLVQLLTGS